VKIVGEVEKILGEVQRSIGLIVEQANINEVRYACSVHMYQCINELSVNVYDSNLALHYNCYKVSFKTLH
jgi:rRNA processing protein Gar1